MDNVKKIYGDRYEILSLIGEGGMACVYSAWDRKLDRKVALKLLHPQFANNPEIRERFYGEAKAISVLDHPNILRIYDFSGENSQESWLVTEILTGKTLADFIKEFPGNRLHPIIATCIVKEITKALIEAHSKNIVHRDIKPENIMILKNGQIKLMDFGIAKNLKKVSMTVTGTFMGSPSYMSPEQIKGVDVDHKTDLYSLGVVFYELLTGDVPYKGSSTHEVIYKITQAQLIPPKELVPSIPEDLNSMVIKLMEKDPEDRYKKAKNFALDLDTFLVLNGFAESNIELERYFSNRKKFEQRLKNLTLFDNDTEKQKIVEVRNDYKTQKMAVVRTVKTLILDQNLIEKRLSDINEQALNHKSRNFEEISAKSIGSKRFVKEQLVDEDLSYESVDQSIQVDNKKHKGRYSLKAAAGYDSNLSRRTNNHYSGNRVVAANTPNYPRRAEINRRVIKEYNDKMYQDALIGYYYGRKSSSNTASYFVGIFSVLFMLVLLGVGYYALQSKVNNNILNEKIETLEQKNTFLKENYHKIKKTKKSESKNKSTVNKDNQKQSHDKSSVVNTNREQVKIQSTKTNNSVESKEIKKADNKKLQKNTNETKYQKGSNSLKNKDQNSRLQEPKTPSSKKENRVVKSSNQPVTKPIFISETKYMEDRKNKRFVTETSAKISLKDLENRSNSTGNQVKSEIKEVNTKKQNVQQQKPQATTGTLIISSRPASDIYINGVKRGTTLDQTINSGRIKLPNGSYSIELRREGYKSYFTNIKIEGGETKNIFGQLRRVN